MTNDILQYEPMLRRLARRYHTTFLSEDDLVQEAYLSLMEQPSQRLAKTPLDEVDHCASPTRQACLMGTPFELPPQSLRSTPDPVKGSMEARSGKGKRKDINCNQPTDAANIALPEEHEVAAFVSNAMQRAIRRYEQPGLVDREMEQLEDQSETDDFYREQWAAVRAAERLLPIREKELMAMMLEQLPRGEMAKRLNISDAALRQRIKRLRQTLRKACPTIIR